MYRTTRPLRPCVGGSYLSAFPSASLLCGKCGMTRADSCTPGLPHPEGRPTCSMPSKRNLTTWCRCCSAYFRACTFLRSRATRFTTARRLWDASGPAPDGDYPAGLWPRAELLRICPDPTGWLTIEEHFHRSDDMYGGTHSVLIDAAFRETRLAVGYPLVGAKRRRQGRGLERREVLRRSDREPQRRRRADVLLCRSRAPQVRDPHLRDHAHLPLVLGRVPQRRRLVLPRLGRTQRRADPDRHLHGGMEGRSLCSGDAHVPGRIRSRTARPEGLHRPHDRRDRPVRAGRRQPPHDLVELRLVRDRG